MADLWRPGLDLRWAITVTVGSSSFKAYDLGLRRRRSLTGREIVWRLVIEPSEFDVAASIMLGDFGVPLAADLTCRCRDVNQIQGIGPISESVETGMGEFDLIAIDAVFAFLGFDPTAGGSATIQLATTYDALSQTSPAFKFVDGTPLPLGAMPGKRVNSGTIEVDLTYFDDDPFALQRTYGGRVSSTTIFGCTGEQILFQGCTTRENLHPGGSPALNWVGLFDYREPGWNHILNPTTGTYMQVVSTASGGSPPYEAVDLTAMFPGGVPPILTPV